MGIGPLKFGMTHAAVVDLLGSNQVKSIAKEGFLPYDELFSSDFCIYFDVNGGIEFFEAVSPMHMEFIYNGIDLFLTDSKRVIDFISQTHPLDAASSCPGCDFLFPDIELKLWRPAAYSFLPEGRHFSSLGLGNLGYFSQKKGHFA